jgi:hypothetical protein
MYTLTIWSIGETCVAARLGVSRDVGVAVAVGEMVGLGEDIKVAEGPGALAVCVPLTPLSSVCRELMAVMVACGPVTTELSSGIGLGSTGVNLVARVQKKWTEITTRKMAVRNKTICRTGTLCWKIVSAVAILGSLNSTSGSDRLDAT